MSDSERDLEYEKALLDPSSVFKAPGDVVVAHGLTTTQKLALLHSWKQDALELQRAASEGMGGGEQSHLRDIELLIEQLEAQDD